MILVITWVKRFPTNPFKGDRMVSKPLTWTLPVIIRTFNVVGMVERCNHKCTGWSGLTSHKQEKTQF